MRATCGCGHGGRERPGAGGCTIGFLREVLVKSERLAGRSRAWLAGRGVVAVSSAGGCQGLPGMLSKSPAAAILGAG